ncbi:MAG: deaminase [Dehalococcoidia bacterium]|nr:deaminase [Dehalococcoidia bacterium]
MPGTTRSDYTRLNLPRARDDRPCVLVNMVTSLDGKAVIEGTERGLGSAADARLMQELRSNVDMVLNGAGTLRASGSSSRVDDADLLALRAERGTPGSPLAAVLSGSGDLPLERPFFTSAAFDAVVYLTERTPQKRVEAIAATGRRVVMLEAGDEVRSMLRHMRRELAVGVLLVEGGPRLNGELFELGAVDELFLTLSPLVVGGHHLPTAVEGARAPALDTVTRLEPLSAVPNPETGELYLRYRVSGRGALMR